MRKSLPPIFGTEPPPPPKRGRSSEVLLTFCNIVLDYEKYEVGVGGDSAFRLRDTSSPLGSTGSTGSSHSIGSGEQREEAETNPRLPRASQHSDTDTVTDDYDEGDDDGVITCFCKKPFGGRAMIECSSCLSWFHLSCVNVRKSAIPEIWYCPSCKEKRSGSEARPRRVSSGSARRKSGESSSATSPSSSSSATGTATSFRSSPKRKL